ncbi:MAG: hypothetical protein WBY44_37350 [Bryobacteraceae bacterium]
MVDFWEVLGRMLTNDNFRGRLYRAFPKPTWYDTGQEAATLVNWGLKIPAGHYKKARNIVKDVVKDGPVSLQTLGEILMVLSSQHFRDNADQLAKAIQATVNTQGNSKLFYIGIGCMVLDGSVRVSFKNAIFDDVQFGNLSGLEQDALATLAGNTRVKELSYDACQEFWDIACLDEYNYYGPQAAYRVAGAPKDYLPGPHLHPIVQPYPPTTHAKGKGKKA